MRYGVPITEQTVGLLERYKNKESITQVDLARESMRLIHTEGKNLTARKDAWNIRSGFKGSAALVLVYNATGATVTLQADSKDWAGGVYGRHPPRDFHNGQWIAFVAGGLKGVQGGRIFRGRNVDGRVRDFLVAWAMPRKKAESSAYTDILDVGRFQGWANVHTTLLKANRISRGNHLHKTASTISIGGSENTSECIAVLQHQFKSLPDPYAKTT